MAEEKPREKKTPLLLSPASSSRSETVVPAPPVVQALEAAKEKKPGFFARLFAGLLYRASPEVEPLEQQERRSAREALRRPVSPEEAREREKRGDELRKLAEVEALKSRLPAPEVEERLLERPARLVEIVVPVKPTAPAPESKPVPKPVQKAEEIIPARERYAPAARLPSTPEAAKKEEEKLKAKAEETEAEVVLKELAQVAEEEAMTSVETGAPVHRRYLIRRQREAAAPVEGVRVRAPVETAARAEFTELMQDVYTQLESSKREETLSEQLGVKPPPKQPEEAAPAPAAEAKPTASMEELLGLTKPAPKPDEAAPEAPAPAAPGTPLFAQLSEIGGKPAPKSQVAFVEVEAKKGMGCPTCHSTNSRIVFCPYCATGMCANCSPKIVPKEDVIVYTCPHCGEEVTLKKKHS